MTATTNVQVARATLGHLAIHYRPGDFAKARVLFEALGAELEDNGPDGFCTIVFDNDGWNYVDNVMYLGQATPVKLALDAAVTEALRVGEADEDPRVTAFRDTRSSSPESLDHVGIRYSRFEALELAVAKLAKLTAPGGELEGRAVVTKYRARAGKNATIDARMASLPLFRAAAALPRRRRRWHCVRRLRRTGLREDRPLHHRLVRDGPDHRARLLLRGRLRDHAGLRAGREVEEVALSSR